MRWVWVRVFIRPKQIFKTMERCNMAGEKMAALAKADVEAFGIDDMLEPKKVEPEVRSEGKPKAGIVKESARASGGLKRFRIRAANDKPAYYVLAKSQSEAESIVMDKVKAKSKEQFVSIALPD